MKTHSGTQRIEYYKSRLAKVQKESDERLEQIGNLMKEITLLRCEINVLRNKINEKENR